MPLREGETQRPDNSSQVRPGMIPPPITSLAPTYYSIGLSGRSWIRRRTTLTMGSESAFASACRGLYKIRITRKDHRYKNGQRFIAFLCSAFDLPSSSIYTLRTKVLRRTKHNAFHPRHGRPLDFQSVALSKHPSVASSSLIVLFQLLPLLWPAQLLPARPRVSRLVNHLQAAGSRDVKVMVIDRTLHPAWYRLPTRKQISPFDALHLLLFPEFFPSSSLDSHCHFLRSDSRGSFHHLSRPL